MSRFAWCERHRQYRVVEHLCRPRRTPRAAADLGAVADATGAFPEVRPSPQPLGTAAPTPGRALPPERTAGRLVDPWYGEASPTLSRLMDGDR